MDCASCGTPLRPTDHFCRKCGAPAERWTSRPRHHQREPGQLARPAARRWEPATRSAVLRQPARPPSPPADVVSHITASATTRGFCSSCGAPLIMDGRFCKACGAPVPGADAGLHVAACGTSLPPDAAFCGICGTPVPREAATVPVASIPVPEPPASGSWFSRHKLPVIIGLIAIVVAAVAAVAIVVPGMSRAGAGAVRRRHRGRLVLARPHQGSRRSTTPSGTSDRSGRRTTRERRSPRRPSFISMPPGKPGKTH